MKIILALVLVTMLLPLAACETSHSESTKTDWFGNTTHQDTTVRENPITGNTTVDQEKTVTH